MMGDNRVVHQQQQQQQHQQQQQQQQQQLQQLQHLHHNHHHNQQQKQQQQHQQRNEVDMLVHSESPHIQEFRLYRELSKEIEKSSQDRVRYVDSELYLRGGGGSSNNNSNLPTGRYSGASGSSETQSAIINIGATPTSSGKLKPNQSPVKTTQHEQHAPSSTSNEANQGGGGGGGGDDVDMLNKSNSDSDGRGQQEAQRGTLIDGNCQVCLIKELKDDLTNVTKLIQERNEQLTSKLKARRLRTFFERQMLD